MLTVMVIITARSKCTGNSYCDNIDNNGGSICSTNSYCENNCNNGAVYVQCSLLLRQ